MSSNRVNLGDGWFLRLDRLETSYLWLSTVAQGQAYKDVGISVSFPPLTSWSCNFASHWTVHRAENIFSASFSRPDLRVPLCCLGASLPLDYSCASVVTTREKVISNLGGHLHNLLIIFKWTVRRTLESELQMWWPCEPHYLIISWVSSLRGLFFL